MYITVVSKTLANIFIKLLNTQPSNRINHVRNEFYLNICSPEYNTSCFTNTSVSNGPWKLFTVRKYCRLLGNGVWVYVYHNDSRIEKKFINSYNSKRNMVVMSALNICVGFIY